MKTYKEITDELKRLNAIKSAYDKFSDIGGIPKGIVHLWELPALTSNYSMGEIIEITVNGKTVYNCDNTREYAKSCKYRATHGYLTFNFTKKDLRSYFEMLSRCDQLQRMEKELLAWAQFAEEERKPKLHEKRIAAYNERIELKQRAYRFVYAHFVPKKSQFNKKTNFM